MTGIFHEKDYNEAVLLEQRRRYASQRMKRIFNAKERLFGIDKPFISKQADEVRRRKLEQKEIDRFYDDKCAYTQGMLKVQENNIKQYSCRLEQNLNDFRKCHQRFDERREFDLNNPHRHKKERPECVNSLRFAGEDTNYEARKRLQCEQTRSWLEQQIIERETAEANRRAAELAESAEMKARDENLRKNAEAQQRYREKLENNLFQYNIEAAKAKITQRKLVKANCDEDAEVENVNWEGGHMMSENCSGMTPEAKRALWLHQAYLRSHKITVRHEKERESACYGQAAINLDKNVEHLHVVHAQEMRQRSKDVLMENVALAREQRLQQIARERLMTNKISPSFYAQFNSTDR